MTSADARNGHQDAAEIIAALEGRTASHRACTIADDLREWLPTRKGMDVVADAIVAGARQEPVGGKVDDFGYHAASDIETAAGGAVRGSQP